MGEYYEKGAAVQAMALPIAYIVIIPVSTCLGHNESTNNFLMNERESLVRPKSRWWAKTIFRVLNLEWRPMLLHLVELIWDG